MPDETLPPDNSPKASGDSTISQSFNDLRGKTEEIKTRSNGQAGKKRGPYKKYNSANPGDAQPAPGVTLGAPGLTDEQVKKAFQGLHSMVALSTDCNVWFLTDDEANCFVPSATSAFNQAFPGVAQSKWGAISLFALCYSGVLFAKTLTYLQYKRELEAKRVREAEENA